MKTDPQKQCSRYKQVFIWAVIHDLVAHPFMALTGYCRLAVRFHDYTSYKAWIRERD